MSAIGSCGIINMVSKHLSGVLDMLKGLIALLHSDIDSIGWRPSLKKQPAADNLCNDFFSNQVRTGAAAAVKEVTGGLATLYAVRLNQDALV